MRRELRALAGSNPEQPLDMVAWHALASDCKRRNDPHTLYEGAYLAASHFTASPEGKADIARLLVYAFGLDPSQEDPS